MYINDISLKKAEWFATLSALAYKNEETHKQFFLSEGIGTFKSLDYDGTQAIMYCNAGEIGIVFRGTQPTEFKDILADLDIRKKKAKKDDGYVHSGFQESLDDLWKDIISFTDKYEHHRLYFAGHSLGGALATLAAARINKCTVYTFGSPRVGGPRFVKNIKCTHYRFMNNNDIVCRIPPAWLGFRHHGEMIYFNRFGAKADKPTWGDMFYGIWNSWKRFKFFDGIVDHGMPNYVKAIRLQNARSTVNKLKKPV